MEPGLKIWLFLQYIADWIYIELVDILLQLAVRQLTISKSSNKIQFTVYVEICSTTYDIH